MKTGLAQNIFILLMGWWMASNQQPQSTEG